jgi:RND family efflux transporter MFP subunit
MNNKILSLCALLLLTGLAASCSDTKSSDKVNSDKPRMVKSQMLQVFNGSVERHITGRLQAAQNTSLSFEVSGVLQAVNVNLGQTFSQGDLLAQLDPKLYKLAVQQSGGLLSEATASQFEAEQTLNRNIELKKNNLIPQAMLDSAQAVYNMANGRVNSAQSALNIAKKNLVNTKLFAPYSGSVSARLVEPNQQINTQTAIFTIQGDANLEVSAAVPESIIGRIALGQQIQVIIPALDNMRHETTRNSGNNINYDSNDSDNETNSNNYSAKRYSATLTEVGTQASIANAFPITMTFNTRYPRVLPGMSAEIILPLSRFSEMYSQANTNQESANSASQTTLVYRIPVSALATDAQGQYVQIITIQNQQYITQKEYIYIIQTLAQDLMASFKTFKPTSQEELEVVTAGVEFIQDKQHVMPLNRTQQIYNQ